MSTSKEHTDEAVYRDCGKEDLAQDIRQRFSCISRLAFRFGTRER